jgi:UrcA family protein
MQKFLLKSTVVALMIGASAAQASSVVDESAAAPQVRVSYADLDMSKDTGRKTLERRVRYAMDAVCGGAGARELSVRMEQMACRRKAMKGAEIQLARAFGTDRNVAVAVNTKTR